MEFSYRNALFDANLVKRVGEFAIIVRQPRFLVEYSEIGN